MSKDKSSKKQGSPIQQINMAAMRQNAGIVEYGRTGVSALGGVTAGVLGLTGFYGFAFYLFCAVFLFFGLMVKGDFNAAQKYFPSRTSVLLSGQFGALFTYILFWTFLYGMVHVY